MKNVIKKRAAFGRGCAVLLCMLLLCACTKDSYHFYESTEETGTEGVNAEAEMTESVSNEADSLDQSVEALQGGTSEDETSRREAAEVSVCYVHICGAVAQPGVYCVSEGSRLYEVILLAGGMTEDAEDAAVNQAQKLTDGMQIYIPTKEEVQTGGGYAAGATGSSASTAETDTRVNINTADLAQLCTLPGIGETRAQAILSYRAEHGAFQSVEDLMRVTGIKAGIYEKIKNLIRV